MALVLVFCRIEVEENLIKFSFLFPVADQVLDAVLLMGCSCKEFLFAIQKELEFFFSPIQSPLPTIEPFGFYKSAVLIQLMEEAVAESYDGDEKNSKECKHPFRNGAPCSIITASISLRSRRAKTTPSAPLRLCVLPTHTP